jgi:glycosyltransferase involved in cell wall biosynthesis
VVNLAISRRRIHRWQPDLLHETYYGTYRGALGPWARVVTVYDMVHELFPDNFANARQITRLKRAAVDRADHVICISDNTRADLVKLFGVHPDKVSVVPLGFDRVCAPGESLGTDPPVLPAPYLLFVGNRGGYKNFAQLLRAVAHGPALRQDFSVVAFGGGDFGQAEIALVEELGLARHRVLHRQGDDKLLGQLYRAAAALVYPSLYEGFGLPPLEAMAQGCPVISSDRSAMPEVIGDAGEFFDPTSVESMATAIERVVYTPSYAQALRELGQRRLAQFTWERCAEQTLALYRSLVVA